MLAPVMARSANHNNRPLRLTEGETKVSQWLERDNPSRHRGTGAEVKGTIMTTEQEKQDKKNQVNRLCAELAYVLAGEDLADYDFTANERDEAGETVAKLDFTPTRTPVEV